MNNISIFRFEKAEVRGFADDNGEPWFCAKDVCDVLGYENPSVTIKQHCRDPYLTKRPVRVVTGVKADGTPAVQQIEHVFINESNLYRLILRSQKPEAEPFETWVVEEVLPTIRKKGGYIAPTATPEQIEALRKDLDHAHYLLGEQEKEITELEVEKKAFEDAARYSDAANEMREAFRFSRALIANGEKYQVQGLIYKALYQEITAVWLNLVDRFVCRYCDDGGGRLHKAAKELLRNLHHSLEYHEWKAPACVKDAEKRLINFTDDLSPIAVILNHEPKANRRYMPKKPDCLK